MRYPRHARVFRGQIDAAPIACVFFAMVLFLFFNFSLQLVPGIRIELNPEAEKFDGDLLLTKSGMVNYRGTDLKWEAFESRVRDQATAGKLPGKMIYQAEPGTSEKTLQKLKTLAAETGVLLERPGRSLDLPEYAGFPAEVGPVVVVGINLNGQLFYQQQRIPEDALLGKLTEAARKSPVPIKLLLQADKQVQLDTLMRVSGIALKAGITNVVLPHKSAPPASSNNS